jgi:tripartite-type tricarboxylate transporter receptor subunit TctC
MVTRLKKLHPVAKAEEFSQDGISMTKRLVMLAIWLASTCAIAPASIEKALAEEFPTRPITWVVPFAPGGITDTTSRIVAEEMGKALGQTVLIDNRGGAGGTVGTEQVARAKPDGYTMIYGTQGTMAANVTLRKELSYDPLKSFLPVHLVGESPNLFVAFAGAPYNSVSEFIAYAKANPGKVTFSSSGVGTATHLVAELFKTVTGVEMLHVPYKGSAPALNDLIAGRLDVMFDYPVSVGPHVEAGKLKVLATTAPERLRAFPNAPTLAELGLKEMTTQSWSSIMVPAGTPAPIVDRLAAAAHAALTSERVRAHFERVGTRPMMQQKAEMIPFIEQEIKRWGDVIERAKLEKQ